MNWWWVNYMGNGWRPKWRLRNLWDTSDVVAELRIIKRWVKESDPMDGVEFSDERLRGQRARIMKQILENP